MNDFASIYGHEKIIENIKNAISRGNVSHAYIISGAKGVGKMTVAKAFAKALQCHNFNGDSCGKCISCKTFDSGNNPDIFYVYPTKTKSLGVEDIREQIVKQSDIKQYEHKYKIFIVPDADKMTEQAQNALLKTLEEPPKYVVIMLLGESTDSFIQTVVSRCVNLKLNPLSSENVKSYLINNENIDEEKASFFAEYAQGNIGKAKELYGSSDFAKKRQDVLEFLNTCFNGKEIDAILSAKNIEEYKNDSSFLSIMEIYIRDVLVYKQTKDERFIIEKDILSRIKSHAKKLSFETIAKRSDAIYECEKMLKRNVNFSLMAEVLAIRLNEK